MHLPALASGNQGNGSGDGAGEGNLLHGGEMACQARPIHGMNKVACVKHQGPSEEGPWKEVRKQPLSLLLSCGPFK